MKKFKKLIFPGICILIVIVTFAMLFYMKANVEEVSNKRNESNTLLENANNNIVSENSVIENTIEDNKTQENQVENTTVDNSVQDEVTSSKEDKFSQNKQEKAIELVKKHWGEDSSVYFTNEGVKSDEEYIVAVRQKTSTAVKNYFKVNINTGSVMIDY